MKKIISLLIGLLLSILFFVFVLINDLNSNVFLFAFWTIWIFFIPTAYLGYFEMIKSLSFDNAFKLGYFFEYLFFFIPILLSPVFALNYLLYNNVAK